jgi:hypothetical protein
MNEVEASAGGVPLDPQALVGLPVRWGDQTIGQVIAAHRGEDGDVRYTARLENDAIDTVLTTAGPYSIGLAPPTIRLREDGMVTAHRSDIEKIRDTVKTAYDHHMARDQMNAYLHLAPVVRLSPLTSELGATLDRLEGFLEEDQ